MRILAAGGDGTVAWILKTIRDLQLDPEPHVAVMPLGTGNDLSLSFGWGNTFLKSWINVSPPHCPPHPSPLCDESFSVLGPICAQPGCWRSIIASCTILQIYVDL